MDTTRRICVVIADDHPVVLAGIKAAVELAPNVTIAALATTPDALLDAIREHRPDIVMTDYSMPGKSRGRGDGLNMILRIRRDFPSVKVVVFTVLDNPGLLQQLLRVPVAGLLSKTTDLGELPGAIQQVYHGVTYLSKTTRALLTPADTPVPRQVPAARALSPRELEVIRMYLKGLSIQEIAAATHRSGKTISNQKQSAMRKIGIGTDMELLQYATDAGLLEWGGESREGGAG